MIIIEDGTGVTGANSYASVTQLLDYAKETRSSIDCDASALLISAARYLETLNFIGTKAAKDNAMQWPRVGALIDGFYVNEDEIPSLLIKLQCEVAISIDNGVDPMATKARSTKKEKVGDIEVEYMDGASDVEINPAINMLARKLVSGGSTGGVLLSLSRA